MSLLEEYQDMALAHLLMEQDKILNIPTLE